MPISLLVILLEHERVVFHYVRDSAVIEIVKDSFYLVCVTAHYRLLDLSMCLLTNHRCCRSRRHIREAGS